MNYRTRTLDASYKLASAGILISRGTTLIEAALTASNQALVNVYVGALRDRVTEFNAALDAFETALKAEQTNGS